MKYNVKVTDVGSGDVIFSGDATGRGVQVLLQSLTGHDRVGFSANTHELAMTAQTRVRPTRTSPFDIFITRSEESDHDKA